MIVSATKILECAKKNKYAIPQFNINNLEWTRYILEECNRNNSNVILGVTESAISYMGGYKLIVDIIKDLVEELNINIDVVIHLDHASSVGSCQKAIDNGFTSVMIDGSKLPYEENVAVVKEVVEYAHEHGVPVEAELGHVGNGADYENQKEVKSLYTDPVQANDFIQRTGIDSLAVAIGTAHGDYVGTPHLDFERLHELRAALNVPLVLHGGSGTGKENLRRCATEGINKINLCTDLHKAARHACQQYVGEVPYPVLCEKIRDAVYEEMMKYKVVFCD